MRPRHGPAHNRARIAHNRAYLFRQSSVFTNRVFNLRMSAAVISFAQRVSHNHLKQCFDNGCSCDTFECKKSACFGAESTRSRTASLSSTCPVVCCAMLGCVQVGSVVWRVTRVSVVGFNFQISRDTRRHLISNLETQVVASRSQRTHDAIMTQW